MRIPKSILVISLAAALLASCDIQPSSDEIQHDRQETILAEAVAQVGMPNIVNFRELKIMKDILELRDQEGLVTYTYMENLSPVVVHGRTALGGKLIYIGPTIGYPIPYATQFTNPEKVEYRTAGLTLPQAEPNGLFSPSSAEASWVLMLDPAKKTASPQYFEPRLVCMTYELPLD